MKKISFWIVTLTLLISTLACSTGKISFFPAQTGKSVQQTLSPQPTTPPPLPSQGQEITRSEERLVTIFNAVDPGVVSIQVITSQGEGLGSGFVYDKEGHIITNYHVVDGASQLEVDFPSGIKVHGKVVGTDLDSDIAVIKVDVPADQLTPLSMGDSDKVQVGQTAIAIGNPYGLTSTMTVGIVSAKGRTLESLRTAPEGNSYTAGDIIQTDASINPGNSGGPLINLDGQVIGINRAIRTSGTTSTGDPVNTGIGFSISINIVKRVVPYLIRDGKYDYPYLGISAREELSLTEMEALGITQTTGAYVLDVKSGGPADKAGLRAGTRDSNVSNLPAGGDLIIAVDGRPVRIFGELLSYLMTSKSPGDKIVLTILRDDQKMDMEITLGRRP